MFIFEIKFNMRMFSVPIFYNIFQLMITFRADKITINIPPLITWMELVRTIKKSAFFKIKYK